MGSGRHRRNTPEPGLPAGRTTPPQGNSRWAGRRRPRARVDERPRPAPRRRAHSGRGASSSGTRPVVTNPVLLSRQVHAVAPGPRALLLPGLGSGGSPRSPCAGPARSRAAGRRVRAARGRCARQSPSAVPGLGGAHGVRRVGVPRSERPRPSGRTVPCRLPLQLRIQLSADQHDHHRQPHPRHEAHPGSE